MIWLRETSQTAVADFWNMNITNNKCGSHVRLKYIIVLGGGVAGYARLRLTNLKADTPQHILNGVRDAIRDPIGDYSPAL